jgi:metal-responsive CopG/Arc/MetJ family transcriptional regulator
MKKISISIDDNLFQELQYLKINNHVNISAFIASAIKEKLDKEKPLVK